MEPPVRWHLLHRYLNVLRGGSRWDKATLEWQRAGRAGHGIGKTQRRPEVSTVKEGQEVILGVTQVSTKLPMTTGGTNSITTLLMVFILDSDSLNVVVHSDSQCLQHQTCRLP